MTVTGAAVLRPAETVASIVLDGEALLFDEATGALHTLNQTATLLWQLVDGTTTIDELAVDLAEGFGAPVETVRADVIEALSKLVDDGVLRPAS